MKKLKKLLTLVLVIALAVTILPVNAQAAVKLNATKKTMYVGETVTLKVSGTKTTPKWSTSNKKIATVSSKGKVTAKADGIATITAKVGKKSLKCKVTVKKTAEKYKQKKIYDDENVIITFTGISGEENDYKINLTAENISERDIVIQVSDISINGFMVDPICSMEISSGKKIKDGITIWDVLGEITPMSKVSDIEVKFRIFDWEDYDFGYETEYISIL